MVGTKQKVAAALIIYLRKKNKKKRKQKRMWVREWIRRRESEELVEKFVAELREGDPKSFTNFVRMSPENFDWLLEKVRPKIEKKNTQLRKAVSATTRLVVTLRFLASGDTYRSLSYLFRLPHNTISSIVPATCRAIYDVLAPEYLQMPNTEDEWLKIASDFETKWNFNHCIGAVDGKHCVMFAPKKSGSNYYNYKHTFSIVLLGVADANYKLTYIDVGCKGRISDGGVFSRSSIFDALETNSVNIPAPRPLTNDQNAANFPYVMVADDAFALTPYMLKPFSYRDQDREQKIFNYRLSRARRIIENVFGIISARFRVLRRTIYLDAEKTTLIVLAVCALHNWLMSINRKQYAPPGTFDQEVGETIHPGSWRSEVFSDDNQNPTRRMPDTLATTDAKQIREQFKAYFNSPSGSVPWQDKMI